VDSVTITVRLVPVEGVGFWHRSSSGGAWRFTRLPYNSVPAPVSPATVGTATGSPAGAGTTNDMRKKAEAD
jgi:hypothetical protein